MYVWIKGTFNSKIIRRKIIIIEVTNMDNYCNANPFLISPSHTNDSFPNLLFSISGGLAYVGGYRVKTTDATRITIPKPSTTETKTNYNITTTQGNYIKVVDIDKALIKPETILQGEVFLEAHSVKNPANANTI